MEQWCLCWGMDLLRSSLFLLLNHFPGTDSWLPASLFLSEIAATLQPWQGLEQGHARSGVWCVPYTRSLGCCLGACEDLDLSYRHLHALGSTVSSSK